MKVNQRREPCCVNGRDDKLIQMVRSVAGTEDLRHTDGDEKKHWNRVCGCGLNSAGLANGEVPSSCEL